MQNISSVNRIPILSQFPLTENQISQVNRQSVQTVLNPPPAYTCVTVIPSNAYHWVQ
uniref:Uncharacterized protein MANES_10G013900 n=1 Tax=Rhizophora mucronata TaxID=61149 RepID=A0A2P2K3W5_RHIMU